MYCVIESEKAFLEKTFKGAVVHLFLQDRSKVRFCNVTDKDCRSSRPPSHVF